MLAVPHHRTPTRKRSATPPPPKSTLLQQQHEVCLPQSIRQEFESESLMNVTRLKPIMNHIPNRRCKSEASHYRRNPVGGGNGVRMHGIRLPPLEVGLGVGNVAKKKEVVTNTSTLVVADTPPVLSPLKTVSKRQQPTVTNTSTLVVADTPPVLSPLKTVSKSQQQQPTTVAPERIQGNVKEKGRGMGKKRRCGGERRRNSVSLCPRTNNHKRSNGPKIQRMPGIQTVGTNSPNEHNSHVTQSSKIFKAVRRRRSSVPIAALTSESTQHQHEGYNRVHDHEGALNVNEVFRKARHAHYNDIQRYLSDGRVDVDARDLRGNTLLMCGAQNGLKRLVKLCVHHGCDINAVNPITGMTGAHYAFKFGHTKVGYWLLAKGANGKLRDNSGLTCLDYHTDDM